MRKKGQGISLETIITAAIVLVVFVVLWAIFTGRLGLFTQGLTNEDVKARAAAANLANTACDNQCVSVVGISEGKPAVFSVRGTRQDSPCRNNQQSVVGSFSDLRDGEICCASQPSQVTRHDANCQ